MVAGPTSLAALLISFQMGFRSLALQKRSSEVWQLLGAIKTELDRYGNVANTLSRQLTKNSPRPHYRRMLRNNAVLARCA
jgi:DNA recombination protein RmuC